MWSVRKLEERARVAAQGRRIDDEAPVAASAVVEVDASAAAVWKALAEIEEWPDFVPGVTRARWCDPQGQPGRRFVWRNAGTQLQSTMEVLESASEVTWTGTAMWLVAVHRNTIEDLGQGRCRLTSSESIAGVGASMLMPSARLQHQLEAFVAAMASRAAGARP
ncbi:SRPBCC family protein [Luteococcus sp. Sow4_B9]|uniref:SRPBCC family protein n=1 Tax=Luteococcus sp. Sow4_B9 TaxID=3438792 RepID=UPI003F995899